VAVGTLSTWANSWLPAAGSMPALRTTRSADKGHRFFQEFVPNLHHEGPPSPGSDLGGPVRVVGQKNHAPLLGLLVGQFPKAIGPDVAVEDHHLRQGIALFEDEGVFQGLGAAQRLQ
jgi:hypothetical protein